MAQGGLKLSPDVRDLVYSAIAEEGPPGPEGNVIRLYHRRLNEPTSRAPPGTEYAYGIAELKSRLSEHLRAVRKGREILVLDRNTPVARIVPCESGPLEVRRALRRPQDLPLPRCPSAPTDSLEVLLEDRGRR